MDERRAFAPYFPMWDQLTEGQKTQIEKRIVHQHADKGTMLHQGAADCTGLILVEAGQLRTFILSEEGREITLFRLFDRDMCLLSAPCVFHSIQFEVMIAAEADTDFWVISAEDYQVIMAESAPLANFTNELMATRFSEVMWLLEQILWKGMDSRVAGLLLSEAAVQEADTLTITHETLASHLGTHREVVTRMLRYFQEEGLVRLSRGKIQLLDRSGLERI